MTHEDVCLPLILLRETIINESFLHSQFHIFSVSPSIGEYLLCLHCIIKSCQMSRTDDAWHATIMRLRKNKQYKLGERGREEERGKYVFGSSSNSWRISQFAGSNSHICAMLYEIRILDIQQFHAKLITCCSDHLDRRKASRLNEKNRFKFCGLGAYEEILKLPLQCSYNLPAKFEFTTKWLSKNHWIMNKYSLASEIRNRKLEKMHLIGFAWNYWY